MRIPLAASALRRSVYLLGGAVVFLWLRIEEPAVAPAALIGWGVSGWLIADWVLRRFGGQRLAATGWCALLSLTGSAIGLGAALAAAGLMLLKNGLHGHVVPDFPFGVIAETLARMPAWGIAGLLAGLGLALALLALPSRPPTDPSA